MVHVVTGNASGSDVVPNFVERSENDRLQVTLVFVVMVYDVLVQRLLGAVEQSSQNMSDGVHAVTCDTKYNTRRWQSFHI